MLDKDMPFSASPDALGRRLDQYIDSVFGSLSSQFLVLPKGTGFVEYDRFEQAYKILFEATNGFVEFSAETLLRAWAADALSFVVVRTMLGLTPPEYAKVTEEATGVVIPQGTIRSLDREARDNSTRFKKLTPLMQQRAAALAKTAHELVVRGAPPVPKGYVHRLSKIDTRNGLESVRAIAGLGFVYPVLLYERFLGRPFASLRDAVSDLVGNRLEEAIAALLDEHNIPYRRTGHSERLPGFDQAPDFIVPNEQEPAVVIEAKIAEDDGTARDKVARFLRLAAMRDERLRRTGRTYELIVCIDGRGFGKRRNDMKDLLLKTSGKVFTFSTLPFMLEYTKLREFASR